MMTNNRNSASNALCCPDVFLERQQGNTSAKPGNTAGNTRATQAPEGQSLREIARQRLGNTRATQAEMPRQHKALNTPPCVATLADDLKLISTWWMWSPEDMTDFQAWARSQPVEASEWIHVEAEKVRDYRDRLHCASITVFIGGTP